MAVFTADSATRQIELFDVFCSAFLVARGGTLVGLTDGGRFVVVDDRERMTRSMDDWQHGISLVDTRTYAKAVRQCQRLQRKAQMGEVR